MADQTLVLTDEELTALHVFFGAMMPEPDSEVVDANTYDRLNDVRQRVSNMVDEL